MLVGFVSIVMVMAGWLLVLGWPQGMGAVCNGVRPDQWPAHLLNRDPSPLLSYDLATLIMTLALPRSLPILSFGALWAVPIFVAFPYLPDVLIVRD